MVASIVVGPLVSPPPRKGPAVCPSEMNLRVEAIDHVFLDIVEAAVLSPTFIDQLLDAAFAHNPSDERKALEDERDRLAREVTNLTTAIAAGRDIPALAAALRERNDKLEELHAEFAKPFVRPDREVLEAALELRCRD